MRPIRSLLVYLAIVFVGGALLAPWLYFLVQHLAESSSAFEKLARNPFHRFVNRSLIVLALAGLWPLIKALRMNSWKEIGLSGPQGRGRNLAIGFGFGLVSLAVVAAGTILTGARELNLAHTQAAIIRHLINATLAAIAVGFFEELVFRGVVFGGVRKVHSLMLAIAFSSGIYAIVHFFYRPPPPDHVTWTTGLHVLGEMLQGFVDFKALLPGFVNLALIGTILAIAYQISGHLYFSMGLHAGWIFWVKSFGFLTVPRSESVFWGTSKLIDGWGTTAVLVLLLVSLKPWKTVGSKT